MAIEKLGLKNLNLEAEKEGSNNQYDPIKNQMRGIKMNGSLNKDTVSFGEGETQAQASKGNGWFAAAALLATTIGGIVIARKIKGGKKAVDDIEKGAQKLIEAPKERLLLPAPEPKVKKVAPERVKKVINLGGTVEQPSVINLDGPPRLALPAPVKTKKATILEKLFGNKKSETPKKVIEVGGGKERLALPESTTKTNKKGMTYPKSKKIEGLKSKGVSLAEKRDIINKNLSEISTAKIKNEASQNGINNKIQQIKSELKNVKTMEELKVQKQKIQQVLTEKNRLNNEKIELLKKEALLQKDLEKSGTDIKTTLDKTTATIKDVRKQSFLSRIKNTIKLNTEKAKVAQVIEKLEQKEQAKLSAEIAKLVQSLEKFGK